MKKIISRDEFLKRVKKELKNCFETSKQVENGFTIIIEFFFQGEIKKITGTVTKVEKSHNITLISITDPEKTYETELKIPFEYVLIVYDAVADCLMVNDGAMKSVPFSATPKGVLNKGNEIKVNFSFQGEKKFTGTVTEVKECGDVIFTNIVDLKETYKTASETPLKYVLGTYRTGTVCLMINDGAVRSVPFVIEI